MNKAVAYCRVSTDSKDQENSLESQKSYFERKLQELDGYEYKGIYADQGLTGTQLNNRPEFNRMLQDAGIDTKEIFAGKDRRLKKKHTYFEVSDREPKFNEIWIKNTSRFARNTLSYEIIDKLRQKGVHIFFVEQNINTKDAGSDLLLKLFQVFDEQDSKDKSIKVLNGIKEGARRGHINTNSRLFGYRYIQAENRLEIIPEEAEIVKRIFDLYSQGLGFRRIRNELNEQGYTTRQGKPFCKTTLDNMIQQEKYAGINRRMKCSKGIVFNKESYAKRTPKEQWIEVETDKIPAIIDRELFDKCQEIRESKVSVKSQTGIYKGITEFAGKIVCGKCGNTYTSNVDRGRRFYNCKTKKLQGTKECDNKNVSLAKLQEAISLENYKKAFTSYKIEYLQKLNELHDTLVQMADSKDQTEVKTLKKRLEELQGKRSKLVDLYLEEKVTKEDYEVRYEKLSKDIDQIDTRLNKLTKPILEMEKDIRDVVFTIGKVLDVKGKGIHLEDDYTQEEILEAIDKIIVYEDTIEVVYKVRQQFEELTAKYDLGKVSIAG